MGLFHSRRHILKVTSICEVLDFMTQAPFLKGRPHLGNISFYDDTPSQMKPFFTLLPTAVAGEQR